MASSFGQLNRREFEVVRLIAQARTNKQIAKVLGTTDGAVEQLFARVVKKLGLRYFQGNLRVHLARLFWEEAHG